MTMRLLFSKIAILLWAVGLSLSIAWAEDPLQEQTEQFFSLPLDGAITLANGDGSIHVYGWYEPRVRVAALRKAYTQSRLRQIRLETEAQLSALSVRTIIPTASGLFADRSGTVDYTLSMPETAHLRMKLVNGEVTLQGLRGGSATIELTNGRISALNCYARVEARSENGVMEVFYEWWENLPAAFDYMLQHGRIAVRLPAAAHFRVNARTGSGRIHNGFKFALPAESGPGQSLEAATAPNAPVLLGLRTGGGNIGLDRVR